MSGCRRHALRVCFSTLLFPRCTHFIFPRAGPVCNQQRIIVECTTNQHHRHHNMQCTQRTTSQLFVPACTLRCHQLRRRARVITLAQHRPINNPSTNKNVLAWTPERGFLPANDPLRRIDDPEFAAWEDCVADLSGLLANACMCG